MPLGNPKLTNRKVLIAEIEQVYGTDIIIGNPGGSHAILASNFTFAPMAASVVKRQRAYPTWGGDPVEVAQKHATIGCEVEMSGSGTPGTPPLYGALLRCCNLEETNTATVSSIYTPLTDDTESTSLHFFWDGIEHRLTGVRGTASLKMTGGALPVWSFQLTGLWNAAADAAMPDVHADLEAYLNAAEVNLANTTCTLFGQNVVMDDLTINLGNTVQFRDRPNAAYVAVTNRDMTGTITFEANTVAAYDWMGAAAAKTTGALAVLQGTTAGNKVAVGAARVQLGNPTYADKNGVLCITVALQILRTAGDDEITFTLS